MGRTLQLLCEAAGDPYWKNGKVSQIAVAKDSGVNQSLISRLLANTTQRMNDDNVQRLAKLFKVSPAQMRGEEPIEYIDGAINKDDLEFIERFMSHPDELKRALKAFEDSWLKKS